MFEVTRGSVVNISTIPKDKNGDQIFPDSVVAYINYMTLDGRADATVTLGLSATDGPYTGNWDTSAVACIAGMVYGSIKCTTPAASDDFEFEIVANAANQGA